MKKRLLAPFLALCLGLSSCSAMLERSYSVSTPHADRPTTAEDPSIFRVENYRELVSAVLYLVSQGAEEGVIQLHNYDGDEEADLTTACLEVSTQDPLGAYAVDYIKHELSRVVSYYQATLAIRYRRTAEQRASITDVTGSWAIRSEVQKTLGAFAPEAVLRVAYFAGDENSIASLIRQAYYDTPVAALGMPKYEVNLYPESGRERVVEILLAYPESVETLKEKSARLSQTVEEMAEDPLDLEEAELVGRTARDLAQRAVYAPGGGSTAYAALVEGSADSEGMALALSLLCRQGGVDCEVVEGTWKDGAGNESPRFWTAARLEDGTTWYADPFSAGEDPGALYGKEDFFALGYRWADGPQEPAPDDPAEETATAEG